MTWLDTKKTCVPVGCVQCSTGIAACAACIENKTVAQYIKAQVASFLIVIMATIDGGSMPQRGVGGTWLVVAVQRLRL